MNGLYLYIHIAALFFPMAECNFSVSLLLFFFLEICQLPKGPIYLGPKSIQNVKLGQENPMSIKIRVCIESKFLGIR